MTSVVLINFVTFILIFILSYFVIFCFKKKKKMILLNRKIWGETFLREHISIPVLMCLKVPVQYIVVHLQLVALFHALILSIRHNL